MNYRFYQDQLVGFSINEELTGIGLIVGCSTTEMAVLGRLWIIRVVKCGAIPSEQYPFNTLTVPETSIIEDVDSMGIMAQ